MDIIINSLYSDKDVFLRELVSNAADACDKKRFLAITENKSKQGSADNLEIRIQADKEQKKLIIEDSGVGMTKDELINNLGRIAQSGTKQFAEMLKKNKGDSAANLIGQFGVGFYSGFLVANKMTVISKGLNDEQGRSYRWESEAGSSYTISEVEGESGIEGNSGTRIELTLREDADEYLDDMKIKALVQRYSEFINFPIKVFTTKTTYEQVEDEEANKDLKEGETPKKKTIPVTKQEWEVQNKQQPLWMRPPSQVTAEQYEEFYKSTFKAFDKPLTLSHFSLEGQVEFRALLYVPSMLPFELGSNMFDENAGNMRLYVKRVFINDKFTELCPRWLKFVKGVIDSEDLPLNVGREILQKSSVLRVVSRRIVKKSLDMFNDIKGKGGEDWDTFQKQFGKYLKVGVIEDNEHRKDIGELITFGSSASKGNLTTLGEYVSRMKEGQQYIYYVSGDGRAQCEMSPALEKVKSNGYEVMYCVEPLDELCMMELKEVDGPEDKKIEIIDLGRDTVKGIDDSEDKKEEKQEKEKSFDQVLKFLTDTLGQKRVSKVEISLSLSDSPSTLAQAQYGMSPQMQKYMKARAVAMGEEADWSGNSGQAAILQVNPNHPILISLKDKLDAGEPGEDEKRVASLLFHVAQLRGGYDITEGDKFASLVTELLAK
ncbi:hypothetical protein GUITHDRAFT_95701 [Guillardia theta CCMP2712]|uniref:Histidine kinase/HSP90-like ATPase domain-containing protein n=1 Tax=Guillardia theta (strain CCMP2712) TaxID=905079 RepID=L1J1Z1_GUITC|nr:hypothetical protein GUITHDRAFT_95701 [Guillardia theta CCMP2712]EKX42297.1 hypothetical protein GUITHDRAFT_95701 [Guillardia theta CCMP2712]|eukprot:XP_005829277.1 hypothetical protein GUITHDRAFT_95701 [Guillardia theta CCMP2712]